MRQPKKLHLKLPDEVLTELQTIGVCPEWFATTVCIDFVDNMRDDSDVLVSILDAWREHSQAARLSQAT